MAYSQEELNTIVSALIIDNTTNQVTPSKVRSVFEAVISSLTVTDAGSVTASPPLYLDSFTNVFSILKADAVTNGYLSKEDWIRYDNTVTVLTTKTDKGGYSGTSQDLKTQIDTKLDASAYNDRWKGKYTSFALLVAAHPTANSGDYAQVDEGAGFDVINYNYDVEDGWIEGGSGSGATNTDMLPEGSSNLYFTTARVLATLLTGISFATGGAIVSTDSVLIAFGKIQKQINDNITSIGLKQDTLTDINFGAFINALTGKTTPIDADYDIVMDSADSNRAKKVSFANRKATLKTYFDTLYLDLSSSQTVSGIKTFLSGKIGYRNVANTFTSFFTNTNTASRTYTLPNSDGTFMLSDAANTPLAGSGSAIALLSSTGVPSRGGNVITLFAFVQSTSITITSASLTSILTGSILGNLTLFSSSDTSNPMLVAGKSFTGKAIGTFSAIASETFNIVIKLGSTTILDTGSLTFSGALSAQNIEINYDFTILTQGASGTVIASSKIAIAGEALKLTIGSAVTVDTTSNQSLDIQCMFGATNAGNTITLKTIKGTNDVN